MRKYACFKNFPTFFSITPFPLIYHPSCLFIPLILIHPPSLSLLHTNTLKVFKARELICSVFLGQVFHNLDCLTLEVETYKLSLEDCTDRLSLNVANYQPKTCSVPQLHHGASLKSHRLKRLKNVSDRSYPLWMFHVSINPVLVGLKLQNKATPLLYTALSNKLHTKSNFLFLMLKFSE
jgi:hypothetical protein